MSAQRGRPRAQEPRTRRLQTMVTEDEYAKINFTRRSTTLSDFLREAVMFAVEASTLCADCDIDAWYFEENGQPVHEDFYVRDKLWYATMPENGILCIGCFEARLGRRLRPADFKTRGATDLFGTPPSARFIDRSGGRR